MRFVVVDVETANSDLSSICQIGIASFRDGALDGSFVSLVNPEDYFDGICVSIHGIDEEKVRGAPKWREIYSEVKTLLQGNIVASHTAFDRAAMLRACEKDDLEHCDCRWLDSAMVVRRAWPVFSRSGYGLSNVAREFGIQYRPHDALEDARCAGEILLRAIAETGLSIEAWLERVKQPIHLPTKDPLPHQAAAPLHAKPEKAIHHSPEVSIAREGNPEGPLYGEVMVFTGTLSIPRNEAAEMASIAGCEVGANVTSRTSLLVEGAQDARKLRGKPQSTKHRKAEELITQGQKIRIISEGDFQRIVHARDDHL